MWAKVKQIVLMAVVLVAPITEALGGWEQIDVNDPEVREAAAKAVQHLENARNSNKAYRLQEVTSAKYQVVRGKNFELVLKIGQTDCSRQANVNVQDCSVVKEERCVVNVNAWQGRYDVTKFACGKEKKNVGGDGIRSSRGLGEEEDVDVNSAEVIGAAKFATAELTSRSNGRYRVQHQRTIKATSQAVKGNMYRMTLEVSVTSSDGKSQTTRCTVKVSDQAWLNPRYTLEEYKCDSLI